MIKLSNFRFFILLLAAHASLLYVLLFLPLANFALSVSISIAIIFLSSSIVYHRLLSHRSWNCPTWYEIFGIFLGIFSFTGTPLTRTLAHRYHHAYSDTPNDPHSPRAHGIFLAYFPMLKREKLNPLLARDILSNRLYMWVHKHYLDIILCVWACSFLLFGIATTLTLFVAPGALCWMNISFCNIYCHWGKNNDPLSQSQIVALFTAGEGFHQHHHDSAHDADFSNGNGFDPGYEIIKLIQRN